MNKELLKKLKKLEEAEKRANAADQAWENEPENEALEAAFDEAYNEEHTAFTELANEIVKMTNNKIDFATASLLIRSKRNELTNLIGRLA